MELCHHGIKGQKWGVRRFQNSDGTWTEEGKQRYRQERDKKYALRTHDDVEKIVRSFSEEDKRLLGMHKDEKEYFSKEATGAYVAKRFISKEGNTPVAWLDVIKGEKDGEAMIAIGTAKQNRGQGHASKLTKRGLKWLDEHSSEFSTVIWDAKKENIASIALAKKNGFVHEGKSDGYERYTRKE